MFVIHKTRLHFKLHFNRIAICSTIDDGCADDDYCRSGQQDEHTVYAAGFQAAANQLNDIEYWRTRTHTQRPTQNNIIDGCWFLFVFTAAPRGNICGRDDFCRWTADVSLIFLFALLLQLN